MTVFISLGILILPMLIVACLKLVPGVFALFFHYASGKYSKRKTDDLSVFFILGAETMVALAFFLINTLINILPPNLLTLGNNILTWIIIGILISLSLSTFLFYFRKGSGTELFISRKIAQCLNLKAKSVKNRSDAFILGLVSGIPEFIFTIPLYILSTITLIQSSFSPISCSCIIIFCALIVVSPLFITQIFYRTDHNLADIAKLRTKNKTFFRFFISFLYLALAALIITFRILIP